MSLKSSLNQIIKDRNGGVFTLAELEAYCHKYPAKLSQAERRLRPSDSPNVERVWNEKRTAIIGYRWNPNALNAPQQARNDRVDQWLAQWKSEPVTELTLPPTLF